MTDEWRQQAECRGLDPDLFHSNVPTAALKPDGTLLVLDPATGRLGARKVETGLANWEQTQITGGLKPGELVVLSLDQEGVEDGVRAVQEDVKPERARP